MAPRRAGRRSPSASGRDPHVAGGQRVRRARRLAARARFAPPVAAQRGVPAPRRRRRGRHDGPRFERGLADDDLAARAWAAFGLERVRPGAGRATLRALADGPIEFAEYGALLAAAALARLGDATAFATIARADAEFDERVPVVQRLYWFGRLGVDEVWPLYAEALDDDAPGVRELALLQLRELASAPARAVIERFIASRPEDDEQTAAARAVLQRIRPS